MTINLSQSYSHNSGEIGWSQVTNHSTSSYEVTRNGTIVSASSPSATSRYMTDLTACTVYDFEVTTIDQNGNRSTPAETSFTTPHTDGTSTSCGGNTVPTPGNFRFVSYGSSLGELLWDRAYTQTGQQVDSYEVRINGSIHDTGNMASSMVYNLQNGAQYTFSIVAIHNGKQSAPSTVIHNN